MAQFTDKEGKVWVVGKLNLEAIERFETATGLSFFEVAVNQQGQQRVPQASFLIGLLYSMVSNTAQSEGIGFTEFKDRIDSGPVLVQAMNITGMELQDFFQSQTPDGEDQAEKE